MSCVVVVGVKGFGGGMAKDRYESGVLLLLKWCCTVVVVVILFCCC